MGRDGDWPASQKVRKLPPGYRHELRSVKLQLTHPMLRKVATPLFGNLDLACDGGG